MYKTVKQRYKCDYTCAFYVMLEKPDLKWKHSHMCGQKTRPPVGYGIRNKENLGNISLFLYELKVSLC